MPSSTQASAALRQRFLTRRGHPAGPFLPVAAVVVVDDVGCGKSHDPETDDHTADGEHPSAGRAIVKCQGGGFTRAEDLPADADSHQKSAENEGEPRHGVPFYPNFYRSGKRQGQPLARRFGRNGDEPGEGTSKTEPERSQCNVVRASSRHAEVSA